jgi:hypothetical protein
MHLSPALYKTHVGDRLRALAGLKLCPCEQFRAKLRESSGSLVYLTCRTRARLDECRTRHASES